MPQGKMSVSKRGKAVVQYQNAKGKSLNGQIPEGQLSAPLAALLNDRKRVHELDGVEVEFELDGPKLQMVRKVGEEFVSPSGAAAKRSQPGAKRRPGSQQQKPRSPRVLSSDFHNPYNFIPTPLRDVDGPLGDCCPRTRDRFHADCYSGTIRVTLTAKTPLLIVDASRSKEDSQGHKQFPLRMSPDGTPHLVPTSVKGMLRAAYEAVTNSRYSVFPKHDAELAYRMPVKDGLKLIPARVETGDQLRLLAGTSEIGQQGPEGPMYGAWLPRYHRGKIGRDAVRYADGELPAHGDEVECWVERFEHQRFSFWRVLTICRKGDTLPVPPATTKGSRKHQPTGERKQVEGHVCVTGPNIDRKHDERVFFTSGSVRTLNLSDGDKRRWKTLILNYRDANRSELDAGQKGPPALKDSEFSRHITGGAKGKKAEEELSEGTLCYALIEGDQLAGLFPVNISRRLHDESPLALLDESLQPATALDGLSPADRVFGWVSQHAGEGAYKGGVRVGPVRCVTEDAIEIFGRDNPLPLAILGAPKPQQTRFYGAKDSSGAPFDNGVSKQQAAYRRGVGLRGRKTYPHHAGLPEDHWKRPMEDRTQKSNGGHHQEYRRARDKEGNEQRDNQNRSVEAWVRPGAAFEFDLHLDNLSRVELGAMLFLLTLPDDHFHRLGGGKPLGFGSVCLQADLEHSELATGEQWRDHYLSLTGNSSTARTDELKSLIGEFQAAVKAAYRTEFAQATFIQAFLKACTGHGDGKPTHYPRLSPHPHPEGLSYEWFVENERESRDGDGCKASLPRLAGGKGLPRNPSG